MFTLQQATIEGIVQAQVQQDSYTTAPAMTYVFRPDEILFYVYEVDSSKEP